MLINTLINKIKEKQNPSVIGLDPQISFIPESILTCEKEKHGETVNAIASAFYEFNKQIIDAVFDIVPAVKPQIAMYEQLGPIGVECYAKTVLYAKSKGLIVIGDIKRSDIASTAACYSTAHIGELTVFNNTIRPFASDFITINPYLGEDSITPFLTDCKNLDKGLFILVKTSNSGSGLFQDLSANGKPVYMHVANFVEKISSAFSDGAYSNIGAVVGATYPHELKQLRSAMPSVFLLVPGYGAQGGTAADIKSAFDKDGGGAIVNSSRGVIAAYQSEKYKNSFSESEFAKAAREAALDMKHDLSI